MGKKMCDWCLGWFDEWDVFDSGHEVPHFNRPCKICRECHEAAVEIEDEDVPLTRQQNFPP